MSDYAAQVAAEVSARYAVAVSAAVVQVVPQGQSGLAGVVWDGSRLISAEFKDAKRGGAYKAIGNAKARSTRRGGLVDPVVTARREKLIELHRAKMTDAQIAAALGCSVPTVRTDRRFLMIRANLPSVIGPRTVTQIRMVRVAQLVAAGASRAEMMADMGVSRDVLKDVAKLAGVALPRKIAEPRVMMARPPREAKVKVPNERVAARRARLVRVADLVAIGRSRRQICDALGVSDDMLRRDVEALSLPLPPLGADLRQTARQLRLEALAVADVGAMTVAELAGDFGCTVEVIRQDLRQLGRKAKPDVQCMSRAKEAELAARRGRVAALVAAGQTQRQIMQAEGIALSTLQNDLNHLGMKPKRVLVSKPPRQKSAPTPAEIEALRAEIKACRAKNMSLSEIVDVVGRAHGTVSYHLKKMGLDGQGRRAGTWKSREMARAA